MSTTTNDVTNEIFNSNIFIWLLWFLAIYFAVFLISRMFSSNGSPIVISRLLDIFIFGGILFYIVITGNSNTDTNSMATQYGEKLQAYIENPYSILSLIIFIIALYVIIYICGIPMDANKPYSISFLENIAWLVFIILLIVDFFTLFLKVDLVGFFSKEINKVEKKIHLTDVSNNPVPVPAPPKKEVFNVSNNLYTYEDAPSVCAAFNADLATYDQIEAAYNDGGEWCNYGWSEGQMAFFPTQKATWEILQKNPEKKNSCGRPGINGGYMANPKIKFGVNCYGVKPKASAQDLAMMQANAPSTAEEAVLDQKAQFWKDNRDKLLHVNSFNHKKWSEN